MAQHDVLGAAIWLTSVFGAGMVLVGPVTPWLVQVTMLGVALCLVSTLALVLWFVRR